MHPSPAELQGLVLGTLLQGEAEQVADHVEQCPDCEATVRQLEAQSDTYTSALRLPAATPEFAAEAQCEEFVSRVAGIGDELVVGGSAKSSSRASAQLGQLGQYQLLEKLGDGGMGAVYKAMHSKLKRLVALKVLPENRLPDVGAVARFEREMEAAGKLQHVNIVAATDAGDHEGKHFLVMEYIAGCDAAQLVARVGRLPVAEASEIVRQAALGLACAHQHGLVHRDVKPSNLMITEVGTVKVLDLGLALLASPQSPGELTSTGQVMGTIDYMAPEQVADAHRVDARADIYSLGATLYKLLAGVLVYHGPQYQSMLQKLRALSSDAAPSIAAERPDLPPALVALVHRLLELDAAKRPQAASEVAALLAPFTAGANLQQLLGQSGAGVQQRGSGSSVNSRLDATRPANIPPVRSSAMVEAKPLVSDFAPPARERRKVPAVVIVIAAVALVALLPVSCVVLTFATLFRLEPSHTVANLPSPSWKDGGLTANDALRFDPGNLTSMTFANGEVRYLQLTGHTRGYVWGTDLYTTDSNLATAAVHAGVLKDGETGIVQVSLQQGAAQHTGSTRNGVTSRSYGLYPQSMRLARATGTIAVVPLVSSEVHEYSTSFYGHNPQVGQTLRFRVTGESFGSVWGTNVYTTDSRLGVAAVHAGVLKEGETGVVRVTYLPGLDTYTGSTRNGVTSYSWGTYAMSYRVERDDLASPISSTSE